MALVLIACGVTPPAAHAAEPAPLVHPMDYDTAATLRLRGEFRAAARAALRVDKLPDAVNSALNQLSRRLAEMPTKFETFVGSEPKASAGSVVVHGIAPSTKHARGHATLCLVREGAVVGAWKLHLARAAYPPAAAGGSPRLFEAGQVAARRVVPNSPEQNASGRSPCFGTIISARDEIIQDDAAARAADNPNTVDGLLSSMAATPRPFSAKLPGDKSVRAYTEAAYTPELCTALKLLFDEADDSFDVIRGPKVTDRTDLYAATVALPGGAVCTVDQQWVGSYTCEFDVVPPTAERRLAVASKLVEEVNRCLAPRSLTPNVERGRRGWRFKDGATSLDIYEAFERRPTVDITISQ